MTEKEVAFQLAMAFATAEYVKNGVPQHMFVEGYPALMTKEEYFLDVFSAAFANYSNCYDLSEYALDNYENDNDSEGRYYAHIQYEEREKAKKMGAHWDVEQKMWYFSTIEERNDWYAIKKKT